MSEQTLLPVATAENQGFTNTASNVDTVTAHDDVNNGVDTPTSSWQATTATGVQLRLVMDDPRVIPRRFRFRIRFNRPTISASATPNFICTWFEGLGGIFIGQQIGRVALIPITTAGADANYASDWQDLPAMPVNFYQASVAVCESGYADILMKLLELEIEIDGTIPPLTPGIMSVTAELFPPELDYTTTIDASADIMSVTATVVTPSVTVTGVVSVTPPTLEAEAKLHLPDTVFGALTIDVSATLITATAAIADTEALRTLFPPVITATAAIITPTVGGALTVAATERLVATASLVTPGVSTPTVSVVVATVINATASLTAPGRTFGQLSLDASAVVVAASGVLLEPTLTGQLSIATPSIEAMALAVDPSLGVSGAATPTITPIEAAAVLASPPFDNQLALSPPALEVTAAMVAPNANASPIALAPTVIDATAQIDGDVLTLGAATLAPPPLSATVVVVDPTPAPQPLQQSTPASSAIADLVPPAVVVSGSASKTPGAAQASAQLIAPAVIRGPLEIPERTLWILDPRSTTWVFFPTEDNTVISAPQILEKHEDEASLTYTLDLQEILEGLTVTSITSIADDSGGDITVGAGSITTSQLTQDGRTIPAGQAVQFAISGGTAGNEHKITATVVDSLGQTRVGIGRLRVLDA